MSPKSTTRWISGTQLANQSPSSPNTSKKAMDKRMTNHTIRRITTMTTEIIETIGAASTNEGKEATTTTTITTEAATTETTSRNSALMTTEDGSKTPDKSSKEKTIVIIDELYEKENNLFKF